MVPITGGTVPNIVNDVHTTPSVEADTEVSPSQSSELPSLEGERISSPIGSAARSMADALLLGASKRSSQVRSSERSLNSAQNTALKAGLKGLIALSRVQGELEDQHIESQRRLQMNAPTRASQGYEPCELIEDLLDDMREMGADAIASKRAIGLRSARETMMWAATILSKASRFAKRLGRKNRKSQGARQLVEEVLQAEMADTHESSEKNLSQIMGYSDAETSASKISPSLKNSLKKVDRLNLEDGDE